ncbi:MAG TPA: hypothetical protein VG839_04735 [Asticcacaulis sp.]|nr:hypothetical protein [Asticcacaulis sp.]
MKTLILILPLVLLPAVACAQSNNPPPPTCSTAQNTGQNTGMNSALPPQWQGWTTTLPVTAATKAADQPEIAIGKAYAAKLQPTAQMEYSTPLGKPPKDGSFGGLFMLTVEKAGAYSIALDQGAWVDVVKDEQNVKSGAFGHGPDCSTIHKYVEFQLIPGHYTIQISAADKPDLTIEVVAK